MMFQSDKILGAYEAYPLAPEESTINSPHSPSPTIPLLMALSHERWLTSQIKSVFPSSPSLSISFPST